ncbi:MAG: peptide chain release factor N(5)-glutamine methyltransferase [bacterium]|nr:peptide chain release factor N(5)-glutamine methyltransferase [bacterium]
MTLKQILQENILKLKLKKIKNPHLEAELLLSNILKKPREFLLTHNEYKLAKSQITKYQSLINRRIKGEPIAYLTGHKEFYGLDFFVNKNTLIPRPETELMVDEAIKLIIQDGSQPTTIIDIGTGSGCIIITLAKLIINYQLQITNYEFFGIDISKKALFIAKKNAKFHNVDKNIKFLHGNLLEPIINNKKYKIQNTKYIILANLPYLTPTQIKNSPTIKYEPKLALTAGLDGLKYYQQLFKQVTYLIQNTKYKIQNTLSVLCEIDPSQTTLIKKLIKKYFQQAKLQIKEDLADHNRLIIITF